VHGIHGRKWGLATTIPYEEDCPGKKTPAGEEPYCLDPGNIGLVLSHYLTWNLAWHQKVEEFLIFEDDAELCENFEREFSAIYARLPPDWQIVLLGCAKETNPTNEVAPSIYDHRYPFCTHAMLIKQSALPVLLETQQLAWAPIDIQLIYKSYPSLRVYTIWPMLVGNKSLEGNWKSEVLWKDKPIDYRDVQGWCDFEALYRRIVSLHMPPNGVAVELGTFAGKSAIYFASEMIQHSRTDIQFYTVDSYPKATGDAHIDHYLKERPDPAGEARKNFSRAGVSNNVIFEVADSVAFADRFADDSVDFVFFDTNHTYEQLKSELLAWIPKLKGDSYFGGHDIDRHEVAQAVTEVLGKDNFWVEGVTWISRK